MLAFIEEVAQKLLLERTSRGKHPRVPHRQRFLNNLGTGSPRRACHTVAFHAMDELIQLGWPTPMSAQERKRKERGLPSAASMSTEELRLATCLEGRDGKSRKRA